MTLYKSGEEARAGDLIIWTNKLYFESLCGKQAIVKNIDTETMEGRLFVVWEEGAILPFGIAIYTSDFKLVRRNAEQLITWL